MSPLALLAPTLVPSAGLVLNLGMSMSFIHECGLTRRVLVIWTGGRQTSPENLLCASQELLRLVTAEPHLSLTQAISWYLRVGEGLGFTQGHPIRRCSL